MKGRNTLLLNTATIMDAVQEYLDKRLVADPDKIGDNRVRVTSITATAINNRYAGCMFGLARNSRRYSGYSDRVQG